MRIEALLVDLDGTLADSIQVLKDIFFEFLLKRGVHCSEEEFESFLGASLKEILVALKDKYGFSGTLEQLFAEYEASVMDVYAHRAAPFPDAVRVLLEAKAKGLKLCLVTAANEKMATAFLSSNGMKELFDALVCILPDEKGKPHPALYLRALEVLKVAPQKAVALEDSGNGVLSALTAGCHVLWISKNEKKETQDKVQYVSNWQEIEKWLNPM